MLKLSIILVRLTQSMFLGSEHNPTLIYLEVIDLTNLGLTVWVYNVPTEISSKRAWERHFPMPLLKDFVFYYSNSRHPPHLYKTLFRVCSQIYLGHSINYISLRISDGRNHTTLTEVTWKLSRFISGCVDPPQHTMASEMSLHGR